MSSPDQGTGQGPHGQEGYPPPQGRPSVPAQPPGASSSWEAPGGTPYAGPGAPPYAGPGDVPYAPPYAAPGGRSDVPSAGAPPYAGPGGAPYAPPTTAPYGAPPGGPQPGPAPAAAGAYGYAPWTGQQKKGLSGGKIALIIVGVVVAVVVLAIIGIAVLFQSASGPADGPSPGQPYTYGDDAYLDGLWDACEAGDGRACDELFWESPVDSQYESFGDTCGGRYDSLTVWCADEL